MDQHKQEEHQRWSESRAKQGINNAANMIADQIGSWTGETFDNAFSFTSGNIDTSHAEEKGSSGLFKGLKKGSKELKKKFVKVLRPAIVNKLKSDGKPENYTDILLAQMATESNWGGNEAGAFNLSGIKASRNKDGTPKDPNHAVLLRTFEYFRDNDTSKHRFPEVISITPTSDGRYKWVVKDYFKTFDSLGDYLNYYVNLIDSKWRVFDGDGTVRDYVTRLGTNYGKGKYFTADPNNYTKLVNNNIKQVRDIAKELHEEYNNGNWPDESLAQNTNESITLPEVEDPNKYLPTYNPFQTKPSQNTSSYSPLVSYSPDSNLSDNYPSAFSSSTGDNSFTSTTSENPNYTSSLNSMGTDVKTMLGILRIMGQTDAQTLEATNNVVSAVGSLKGGGTAYTPPPSTSFTDEHYNQNPIS